MPHAYTHSYIDTYASYTYHLAINHIRCLLQFLYGACACPLKGLNTRKYIHTYIFIHIHWVARIHLFPFRCNFWLLTLSACGHTLKLVTFVCATHSTRFCSAIKQSHAHMHIHTLIAGRCFVAFLWLCLFVGERWRCSYRMIAACICIIYGIPFQWALPYGRTLPSAWHSINITHNAILYQSVNLLFIIYFGSFVFVIQKNVQIGIHHRGAEKCMIKLEVTLFYVAYNKWIILNLCNYMFEW